MLLRTVLYKTKNGRWFLVSKIKPVPFNWFVGCGPKGLNTYWVGFRSAYVLIGMV